MGIVCIGFGVALGITYKNRKFLKEQESFISFPKAINVIEKKSKWLDNPEHLAVAKSLGIQADLYMTNYFLENYLNGLLYADKSTDHVLEKGLQVTLPIYGKWDRWHKDYTGVQSYERGKSVYFFNIRIKKRHLDRILEDIEMNITTNYHSWESKASKNLAKVPQRT